MVKSPEVNKNLSWISPEKAMDHSAVSMFGSPVTAVPCKLSVDVYHVADVGGKDLTFFQRTPWKQILALFHSQLEASDTYSAAHDD